jgi:hypothetical protein
MEGWPFCLRHSAVAESEKKILKHFMLVVRQGICPLFLERAKITIAVIVNA